MSTYYRTRSGRALLDHRPKEEPPTAFHLKPYDRWWCDSCPAFWTGELGRRDIILAQVAQCLALHHDVEFAQANGQRRRLEVAYTENAEGRPERHTVTEEAVGGRL